MWCYRKRFESRDDHLADADNPNYINCLRYVTCPLEEDTVAAEEEEAQEKPPKLLESFVIGCDNGIVLKMQLPWRDDSDSMTRALIHRHSAAVLGMETLGTLVATASADKTVALATWTDCRCVAVLPHPTCVRCVSLWEGRHAWKLLDDEESAVYVITGSADTATIRIWRVHIQTGAFSVQAVCVVLRAARLSWFQRYHSYAR